MKVERIQSIHRTGERRRPQEDLVPTRKKLPLLRGAEVPGRKEKDDEITISKGAMEKFLAQRKKEERGE